MRRGMMELAATLLVVAVVAWLWLNRSRPEAKPKASLPPAPVASDIVVSPKQPAASAPAPVSPAAKVALLRQILESRNDNDPRLDTEFRHLDAPAKQALIAYYHQLPVEDANGRGTIVFLLGREITSPDDLSFFDQVLDEKIPKLPPSREGSLPMALLAAYPQVMAVSALSAARQRASDPEVKKMALVRLQMAAENSNSQIATRAKRALRAAR